MGTVGTIDPQIEQQLVAAGLSVDDVLWLIQRAIDEDLDGGVDVTLELRLRAEEVPAYEGEDADHDDRGDEFLRDAIGESRNGGL